MVILRAFLISKVKDKIIPVNEINYSKTILEQFIELR